MKPHGRPWGLHTRSRDPGALAGAPATVNEKMED